MKKSELLQIIREEIQALNEAAGYGDHTKYISNNEKPVATNRSYWQWEYDSDATNAWIFFNTKTSGLRLVIEKAHIKSGLGKGVHTSNWSWKIGDLKKPELGKIRPILKDKGNKKTRGGYPFPVKWTIPGGKELSLGIIMKGLKKYWNELQKKNELKEIELTINEGAFADFKKFIEKGMEQHTIEKYIKANAVKMFKGIPNGSGFDELKRAILSYANAYEDGMSKATKSKRYKVVQGIFMKSPKVEKWFFPGLRRGKITREYLRLFVYNFAISNKSTNEKMDMGKVRAARATELDEKLNFPAKMTIGGFVSIIIGGSILSQVPDLAGIRPSGLWELIGWVLVAFGAGFAYMGPIVSMGEYDGQMTTDEGLTEDTNPIQQFKKFAAGKVPDSKMKMADKQVEKAVKTKVSGPLKQKAIQAHDDLTKAVESGKKKEIAKVLINFIKAVKKG